MRAAAPLFRFTQFEVPWALGPPDGRYLVRAPDAAPGERPAHVLAFATLGAPLLARRMTARRRRQAPPEPEPAGVSISRATAIAVSTPLAGAAQAQRWLAAAGEAELLEGLMLINRALHAFRLASADPFVHPVERRQVLVARIGYGAGDEVADGRWSEARELIAPRARTRRARVLEPQAQLAAVLGGRRAPLACEELTLRARLDLGQGRVREAALQLSIALDAALAELPATGGGARADGAEADAAGAEDARADDARAEDAPAEDARAITPGDRLTDLQERRAAVAAAAQAALAGALTDPERGTIEQALRRLEAALRARAVSLPDA